MDPYKNGIKIMDDFHGFTTEELIEIGKTYVLRNRAWEQHYQHHNHDSEDYPACDCQAYLDFHKYEQRMYELAPFKRCGNG